MNDAPAYARAGLRLPPCVVAFESLGPRLGGARLALRLGGWPGHVQFSKRAFFFFVVADPSSAPPFLANFRVAGGRPSDFVLSFDVIEIQLAKDHPPRFQAMYEAMSESWRAVWADHLWRIKGGSLQLTWTAPKVVGVLNVTPDSFSDGGRWIDVAAAVEHGEALARAGAAAVDVGGESTRPGAERVPASLQIERILPVIERLVARISVPIVVDTTSAEVARAALAAGAAAVNDTSALADDPALATVVAEAGAGLQMLHRRGRRVALHGGVRGSARRHRRRPDRPRPGHRLRQAPAGQSRPDRWTVGVEEPRLPGHARRLAQELPRDADRPGRAGA